MKVEKKPRYKLGDLSLHRNTGVECHVKEHDIQGLNRSELTKVFSVSMRSLDSCEARQSNSPKVRPRLARHGPFVQWLVLHKILVLVKDIIDDLELFDFQQCDTC